FHVIADDNVALCRPYRSVFEAPREFLRSDVDQGRQFRHQVALPRMKLFFPCRDGEPVPGTNILAVVATIDAIADQRAQLPGYRSAQLDGEIGNAETGVHNIRRDDRPCRTRSDTKAAGAAVIIPGTVGFQLEAEEHYADTDLGTLPAGYQ